MANDKRPTDDLAPETNNSEQDADADAQSQRVAEEARLHGTELGLEDSEKVSTGDDTDDVPDLVDRMKAMVSSGHIDMDAYRGEPNDDDDVDELGQAANDDGMDDDGLNPDDT